ESGSGAETDIYSGSTSSLIASFQNVTNIKFPRLAATSGHFCLQVDNAGYISNTGAACGSGGGGGDDGYAGVTSAGKGGLAGNPGTGQTWEITPSGFAELQGSITATSPVCDIRAYGAQLGAQDIGPFIQDCVNNIYPWASGNTQTILLDCGNHSPGCYWANPSALTFTYGGPFRFELEGYLTLGSPLVTNSWENWYGIGPPGAAQQFQTGTPALMGAPQLYGTLGTAVTTGGQPAVVTPTFGCSGTSENSMFGNCNIASMPAGSAITIAGTTTTTGVSATTSLPYAGASYRFVTLTLPSQVRYVPLETLTVSGCSDATLNITNGVISGVDFSAPGGEQVMYQQNGGTITSATGCSITSFDEDKFESVRLFCSNGTSMSTSVPGIPACGTGQFTIYPLHAHSASDVWGAVGVSTELGEENGHTFHDINISGSYGMSYWGEQESDVDLYNVGMNPEGYLTAGGMEQTASWVETIGQLNYSPSTVNPGACLAGGCSQPSYPYGLRCDSQSVGINTGGGSGTNTGCAATTISGGSFIGGGIKIDGGGVNPITAMPYEIKNMLFEEAPSAAVVVDNRNSINTTSCLWLHDNALQDNVTGTTVYYLA
ncbi:MAG: hypothetical protein ACRD3S_11255, partial [Terracidiphilus sp.]